MLLSNDIPLFAKYTHPASKPLKAIQTVAAKTKQETKIRIQKTRNKNKNTNQNPENKTMKASTPMQRLFLKSIYLAWDKIEEGSYLRSIPSLQGITELSFSSPVTFFVGENGTGKSTLLEAIAIAYGFNPEGGTKNYCFATYESHSSLHEALTLVSSFHRPKGGYFYRAESFYNVATQENEYSKLPGGRPMHFHEHSHGESFLLLANTSFKPEGFYLLDEPEAALSPARQLTLLAKIHACVKEGAQFLIATHSPILLGLPEAQILSFDEGPIHPIRYEDTDSYQITELFINHRKQLLHNLLTEAE